MDFFQNLSYLMIEANSACNLKCQSCTRELLAAKGLRPGKRMSEPELRHILDQVRDCPIRVIKFQGLSEPMLHPEFDRLTLVLREYFPDAFLIVTTNLQYRLQNVKLRETLPLLNMLGVSIDGVGATYERLRKGASYPRMLRTLDELSRDIPRQILEEKVFINFIAMEENYRELPSIYELKEKYGLAGVRINLAQNWDIDQRNTNRFSDEMIEALQEHRKDVKGVGGWEYRDCFWPFQGVMVDVFGDVRQCVLATTQKPLGNLFRQPLREIFNQSETLMRVRASLGKNCAAESCSTCDYFHLSPILARIHGRPYLNHPYSKTAVASP